MTATDAGTATLDRGPAEGAGPPVRRPPRQRRWRLAASQTVWWALVCVLVIGPLAPLVYTSFLSKPYYLPGGELTLGAYTTLFQDPEFWSAVENTLIYSVAATAIGLVLGASFAVLCGRTNMPGRRLYSTLVLAPLVIPPLGLIVGWVAIYSKSGYITGFVHETLGLPVIDLSSLTGMSLLGGSLVVPIVFVTCRAALTSSDSALEDAARSAGAGPLRTLCTITVPMLRPALLNSALLIFALSVEILGIPQFLGAPTHINFIASYLYQQWSNGDVPDPPFVSAGAVLFLLFVSTISLLRRALLGAEQRFVGSASRGGATPHPVHLGRAARVLASSVVAAFLLLTCAIPILGLIVMSGVVALTSLVPPWRMLTGSAWHQVATDAAFHHAIVNSLIVAVLGGAITIAVVAVATVLAHRSKFALRGSLPMLLAYPRAIPGIVLGVGFFWTFLIVDPPGGFLRSTLWGEMLALCVHNITLAYLVIYPSLMRVNVEHDHAAQAAGAGWWRTTFSIRLPGISSALVAAYLLMFIALFNDYDPAVFLAKPGTEILGVTMLTYWQQGLVTPVAALSVVQVAIVAVALGVGALIVRKGARRA